MPRMYDAIRHTLLPRTSTAFSADAVSTADASRPAPRSRRPAAGREPHVRALTGWQSSPQHQALAALLVSAGVLCALVAAAPAHAQATASPRAAAAPASAPASAASAPLSKGEIKAMREFKMLDFNGDNKLSRSEVALFPRLAGAFDDADTDHDGYVSYEEVRAFAIKYRAERDKARAAAAAAAASAPAATQ
ncbi:EF-hand domain-containing protein [Paracidovorax konjaci]